MRKKVIAVSVGLLFFALSIPAQAQPSTKLYRIGYLSPRKSIVLDWRFVSGKSNLFPDFAAELVHLNVDAIVCQGIEATGAAKKASTTIPIVMSNADVDPVELGLIASLARPGGNVTGFTSISSQLAGKRLELLKEAVPKASRIAIISRPRAVGGAAESHVKETEIAARALGIQLQSLEARGPEDLENAFRIARKNAQAMIVVATGGMINDQQRILDLVAKTRLPVMYTNPEPVITGGLMSYAADLPALARGATEYVDRIFKGTKPADLPVQQPKKFEFVVNLKAAKQIGVTVPPNVLARADKVIR